MSLLVIYEILELFFNTLTVHDRHSLRHKEHLPQSIQMHLSQKLFPNLLLHFRNLHKI